MKLLSNLNHNFKFYLTICTPILLSAIPIVWKSDSGGKEPYAAFVIILMSIYWMTECIPLAVTAFIPIILYPLFGILSTDVVTRAYLQDSIFFLFGGCVLALSFEYSNLHTRVALRVILLIGAGIPQLLFGIMMTSMFLSMWMNNTSTTAMMVPIVHAIMSELQKEMESGAQESRANNGLETLELDESEGARNNQIPEEMVEQPLEKKMEKIRKKIRKLRIMFLLGTAWASNIGGTGVITGSGSNVVALDLIRKDADDEMTTPACKAMLVVGFLDWMVYNVPPMLINTVLTWIYLQIHFLGLSTITSYFRRSKKEKPDKSVEHRIRETIRTKYEDLGSLKSHEVGVLILFSIVILLWIFKDPRIIPGWDSFSIFEQGLNGKSYIKEATPTFLIVVLLCCLPSKSIYYTTLWSGGLAKGIKDPLLHWDFIYSKFPWGLFMLLGGGTALAVGAKESQLNKWVGLQLESSSILRECPDPVVLLIILLLVTVMTTIASNTATAAIVTPVLLGITYAKDVHPLFLVLAGTTVCSYAFVLPVSTPPNAIVYSSTNDIKISDMVVPGLMVNVICISTLILTTYTTSSWFFNFNGYNNECSRHN